MMAAARRLDAADPAFPKQLLQVRPQPAGLHLLGDATLLDRPLVAIVGARDPSPYGMKIAYAAAQACARAGLVVVSGLARGLDAQAHRGALDAGGGTIAVLGCGLDVPYPRANLALRADIAAHGLLISEFDAGTRPAPWTFPQRNRIIAGLAKCLLVVEGRARGGTSNTVWWTLSLDRAVFAVPGRLDEPLAEGPNLLLQQGARVYLAPRDLFDEFGLASAGAAAPAPAVATARTALSGAEASVYDAVLADPLHVDDLRGRVGLDPGLLLAALSSLEIQGLIRQLPGKHFARAS